jgi:putative endonuclease
MDPRCHLAIDAAVADVAGPDPARPLVGALGERLAAGHLAGGHACEILVANWRVADEDVRGELDLIAVDPADGTVVFCEVKTRRDARRFDGALAALGPRQQARIRRLAVRFLATAELGVRRVRFDLVAVDLGRRPSLTHVPDAW